MIDKTIPETLSSQNTWAEFRADDDSRLIFYNDRLYRNLSTKGRALVTYVEQNENNLDYDTLHDLFSNYITDLHNNSQSVIFFPEAQEKLTIKERQHQDISDIILPVLMHNNFKELSNKLQQHTEIIKFYQLVAAKNSVISVYQSMDLDNKFVLNNFANSYNDMVSLLKYLDIPEKKFIDHITFSAIKAGQLPLLEFLVSDEERKKHVFSERENNKDIYTRWALTDTILHNKPFLFKYLYAQNPHFVKTDSCGVQIADTFISFNKKKGWYQFDDVSNFLHEDISKYFTDKTLGKTQKKLLNGHFLELAEAYYYIKHDKNCVSDLEMLGLLYINKDMPDFFIKEFQPILNEIGLTISPKMQLMILDYRIQQNMTIECIDREWIFNDKNTLVHQLFFEDMVYYPDSRACKLIQNNLSEFQHYFKDYPQEKFESLLLTYAMREMLNNTQNLHYPSGDKLAICSNEIIKSIIDYNDYLEKTFSTIISKETMAPLLKNVFSTLSETTSQRKKEPIILSPQGEKYLLENDFLISNFLKQITIEPRKIKRI